MTAVESENPNAGENSIPELGKDMAVTWMFSSSVSGVSGVDLVRPSGVVAVFFETGSAAPKTAPWRLSRDGDQLERRYAPIFLNSKFPAYEEFWIHHIVPLTKRDTDGSIHFKTDAELRGMGKGREDILRAQRHHTVLRHLARAYKLQQSPEREDFVDGITRLVSALDVAVRLLREVTKCRADQPQQFEALRDYRHAIVHDGALPEVHVGGVVYAPGIGLQEQFDDWRTVTAADVSVLVKRGDFLPAQTILSEQWSRVIEYCQIAWTTHLIGQGKNPPVCHAPRNA